MKSLAYVSVSIVSTKFPSCYYYGDYFMKLYAYQSVRFHNPRPIFTLIGMLFLALDARGEVLQSLNRIIHFCVLLKTHRFFNLIYHSIHF